MGTTPAQQLVAALGQLGALGRHVAFALLLLSASHGALAQSAQLSFWAYSNADSSWPVPPSFSVDPLAVSVNDNVLSNLEEGDILSVPANEPNTPPNRILITEQKRQVNGDNSYRGTLLGGADASPFVLTVSPLSVFAYIEIDAQVWQLDASRAEAFGAYRGWLYQGRALESQNLVNDYVIVEHAAQSVAKPETSLKTMPLTLGSSSDKPTLSEARNSGINASNFAITQQVGNGSVVVGDIANVSINLRNSSNERHEALTLNIYFVLENSALVQAPSNCKQGLLSGQIVLQCALGDFAPSEAKTVNYSVRTSANSKPRLISTALVGGVQQDTLINVVEDVLIDSDGDGISDFNEKLLGTNPQSSDSLNKENSVIDVLALYTPGANALYNGHAQTRINQLIAISNQIYADSGVGITLRPVFHSLVAYSDSVSMDKTLDALTKRSDAAFANVDALRTTYGADLVMLFRPQGAELDRCGLANLGGLRTQGDMSSSNEKAYAFSTMAIDCPVSSVIAHELGHNMGLTHSHLEDGFGGTFDYATGYGVDGKFATVMAYPGAFNTTVRLPRFSSPSLDCLGFPCGRAANAAQGADAVRALNVTRHQIAQYYPTRVPYLPNRPLATLTGTPTDARIALAVSVDNGLSYVSAVRPGVKLDVNLSLFVDSRHVGKTGDMFVLVTLDGEHFVMLDSAGGLSDWDGSFAGLRSYRPRTTLASVEYLQIVNATALGEEFINRRVQIFIGYSVPETGEVVYTAEPLTLDVTP